MDEKIGVDAIEFPAYVMNCIKDLDIQITDLYNKMNEMAKEIHNIREKIDSASED